MTVTLRKPPDGHNHLGVWVESDTLARRWRDVYVGNRIVGNIEREDGEWWLDTDNTAPAGSMANVAVGARLGGELLENVRRAVLGE